MNEPQNSTNIAVSNRRRSQRVYLKVRVVARFLLLEREWVAQGDTIVVNAHGGTVRLPVAPMSAGDIVTLTNPATDQAETCRVVRIEAVSPWSRSSKASTDEAPPTGNEPSESGFVVAFAFDRPAPNFWGVAFPPTDWIEAQIEE
jgi:hypothetical protein